jgi:hypothetical protein
MTTLSCWHCLVPIPESKICCDDREHWLCDQCDHNRRTNNAICPDCNERTWRRNPDHGVD